MNEKKLKNGESELKDLIKIVLRNEDLDGDIDVKLIGTSNKGCVGDILFLTVTGSSSNNEPKRYDLALKCGKKDPKVRKAKFVQANLENEMFVYRNVIPAFQEFLQEKIQPKLNGVAECYSTAIIEGIEYIALQNLKELGYELNRKPHLDKNHLKLTLQTYGRWHALSLALKDQNKELYDQISPRGCLWQQMYKEDTMNFAKSIEERICKNLNDDQELLGIFKEKYSPMYENWLSLLREEEVENVISHGDCWSTSFLFYYEPDDKLKLNPTNVVMLDFQLSQLASPVVDLSYHIFMVATGKELDNLKGLLDIYYESLAENIRKLGSDPNKLFSYDALIRHWKKYHLVGLLLSGLVLPITLVDKEDTVNIEDMNEETMKELMNKMVSKTKENLDRRMIEVVKHAVTYEL